MNLDLQRNDIFIDNIDYIIKKDSKISNAIKNNLFLKNINILHRKIEYKKEDFHYKDYNKMISSIFYNTEFLKLLYKIEEIRCYLVNNEQVDFEKIRLKFNCLMIKLNNHNGFYTTINYENDEITPEKYYYSFPKAIICRYTDMINMFVQDDNRDKNIPYREQLGIFLVADNEDVEYFLNNYISHYICLNDKYIPLNNKDIIIELIEQIYYNIIFYNQCDEITNKYNNFIDYIDNYKK